MYYRDTYYSYKRIKRGMLKVGCFANPSSVTRCTLKLPNVKKQSVEIITMPLCYEILYIAELLLFVKHHYCNISMWCHYKEIVAVDMKAISYGFHQRRATRHRLLHTSPRRGALEQTFHGANLRYRAVATVSTFLTFKIIVITYEIITMCQF